jgi:hypothetical protein
MTKSTRTLGMIAGTGLGLLVASAGFPATARADSPPVDNKSSATTSETVVITAIDRPAREVTLTDAHGESKTVQVPPEVKAFNTIKVGDYVDIDYTESVAVSMLPPGAKPTSSEVTGAMRTGHGVGTVGRETSVSAEIISVDAAANKVTFKGPRGRISTVSVTDPALQRKLPNLKPGQVVQMTYTEAMAMALRPTSQK